MPAAQGTEISLEGSTAPKTWTPATLGTYTASTNNLFFRLKLNRL